jgi:hypothetical protein
MTLLSKIIFKGKNSIYFGVITIIPFDNLYRQAYFVMHTFLVQLYQMVTLTFDPKINRVLPLPQGNHVAMFVKIQYTELKLSCGNDPVVKNYIYSNSDLDLYYHYTV